MHAARLRARLWLPGRAAPRRATHARTQRYGRTRSSCLVHVHVHAVPQLGEGVDVNMYFTRKGGRRRQDKAEGERLWA